MPVQSGRRCRHTLRAALRGLRWRSPHDPLRGHPRHPLHRPRHGRGQLVRGLAPQPGGGEGGRPRAGRVTRVLVLTALDVEARGLARHLGLAPVPGASSPHFIGGVLELATIGLRGARLAERAAGWRAPELVVSAGACGALAPALAVGALVVPTVVLPCAGQPWPPATLPTLSRASPLP